MVKIWLDDIRPAPEGWIHAKSVLEAIKLFKEHYPDISDMSLDHDLGDDMDGIKLVLWMAENGLWPRQKPRVHSMNPVGRTNMEALIERYFE